MSLLNAHTLNTAIRVLFAFCCGFVSFQRCQCTARDLRLSVTRHISNLPRRIASDNSIRWYVLRDNAGSSNYTTFTDADTWQDGSIATDPAILSDMDLGSSLRSIRSVSDIRIQRMRTTE